MDQYPDDAVDRLAEISSYHEARRKLGLPQPDPAEFSVDAIKARQMVEAARINAHEYNQALYNLTGPDNRTEAERGAQRDINSVGRAAVDAALEAARANKQP